MTTGNLTQTVQIGTPTPADVLRNEIDQAVQKYQAATRTGVAELLVEMIDVTSLQDPFPTFAIVKLHIASRR